MSTVSIPNGLYFVSSPGACWVAGRFEGGRLRWMAEEAAPRGVAPRDTDREIVGETADAVAHDLTGAADSYGIVVTRAE